jgi:peptide/nickel transport system permease protein
MGTDSLGQDILARILYGGRISIAVGLVAAFVAISLGTIIGAIAGFFGGFIDSLLMRITDLFHLAAEPSAAPAHHIPVQGVDAELRGGVVWVAQFWRLPACGAGDCDSGLDADSTTGAGEFPFRQGKGICRGRQVDRATRGTMIGQAHLPNVLSPDHRGGYAGDWWRDHHRIGAVIPGSRVPVGRPNLGQMLFQRRTTSSSIHMRRSSRYAHLPDVLSVNYIGDGLRDALDPRKIS